MSDMISSLLSFSYDFYLLNCFGFDAIGAAVVFGIEESFGEGFLEDFRGEGDLEITFFFGTTTALVFLGAVTSCFYYYLFEILLPFVFLIFVRLADRSLKDFVMTVNCSSEESV